MKNKNLMISSLFIALGLVLHMITPGLFGSMKPDFLLAAFFVSLCFLNSYTEVMAASVVCALLAALTTTMPGGQIANIIDKLTVGPVVFTLIHFTKKSNMAVKVCVVAFLGTVISGVVFVGTLSIIGALPFSFLSMISVVVLPTAIANSILFYLIIKIPTIRNKTQ